ncbi:BET4 [[Candida] subhashii]|uniref:Geranylgeranyl transferase type-2 subunit alpha n=1 Tax=[Candida] subhashii TaxID=561895 RepID=A0A8J5QFP1_9ASCO|nr:BET4 [[Candida] subhashii]KAG7661288.1 BET4 [[Candida] subhashii]
MQHGIKRQHLTENAKQLKLQKDEKKIINYQQLTNYILQLRDNDTYTQDAFNDTTNLLILNPEFYTIWNYRREILLHLYKSDQGKVNDIDTYAQVLTDDLQFVLSQLKKYPKCYWIWNHRSWCLFELVEIDRVSWAYEFGVVSKLLEMDQRNFHGWQYRRFVVENIEREAIKKTEPGKGNIALLKINLDEFAYTTSKVQKDFSNFSAWHNRAKLIPKVYDLVHSLTDGIPEEYQEQCQLFQDSFSILQHDLDMIKTGIYMSPEDTSVWSYLYWLLTDEFFMKGYKEVGSYLKVLEQQVEEISELNELEKEDHNGIDNIWCLKSIIFIKALIQREKNEPILTDYIKESLKTLTEIDPLRKGRYLDQLSGKAAIL